MSTPITVDGVVFTPAIIEGNVCVFKTTNFKLVKQEWQADNAVASCPLCKSKFGGLKRRHHCRQCGMVVCNKCCNEKVPLPQLGIEDPERVCEQCLPITSLVTKARSHMPDFQLSAARNISDMCKNSSKVPWVFRFGGYHTLLALGKINLKERNIEIMWQMEQTLTWVYSVCKYMKMCLYEGKGYMNIEQGEVARGLHTLSTYEPLHEYMVNSGMIMALSEILKSMAVWQDMILLDCISALMIYCKTPRYAALVRDHGALPTVLELCCNHDDTVALMSVSTLSLLVVHPSTHEPIINGDRQALQRLLGLAAADNEQMQAVALKCLNYLSMGIEWNKHRIVQEDFSAGRPMKAAVQSKTTNMQVLANAVCLVANLATSVEDQGALSDCLECLLEILQNDISNKDLLMHLVRGLANFSAFEQNSGKLIRVLPLIIRKCLKHEDSTVSKHAMRVVLNMLKHQTNETVDVLLKDGAGRIFKLFRATPDMMSAMLSVLLNQLPDMAKPL